jgi:hypothetical protein
MQTRREPVRQEVSLLPSPFDKYRLVCAETNKVGGAPAMSGVWRHSRWRNLPRSASGDHLTPIARLRSYDGPALLSYGFRPLFLLAGLYAGAADANPVHGEAGLTVFLI